MENSNVNRLSFGASLVAKFSSLIMIILHVYCFLAFYNGVIVTPGGVIGFSGGFDAVSVIENTLKILADVAFGSSGILTILLPLLQIAFLVVALVNIINAFVRFFMLFGGAADQKLARNQKNTFIISKKLIGSGMCMLVFMMLGTWVRGAYFTTSALLVIMALSAGIIISRFANAVLIRAPFTTVVMQIVYSAIMLGIIGMVMMFTSCDVISDVDLAIEYITKSSEPMLITANGLLAGAYVLLGVVMLNTVLMVRGCKSYALIPNRRIRKSGNHIFICAIVAVSCVILGDYLILDCDFKTLYDNVIEPMIPILLSAAAAYFFSRIQPKISKPKCANENDDSTPENPLSEYEAVNGPEADAPALPEANNSAEDAAPAPLAAPPVAKPSKPKIVFVGKRVKKIKSKTYRDRKDINIIVIPESVNYVEGYSFYGCTELKEIHCERESQTRLWHKKWNFGCPAKVIWNSSENDEA